jgi:hypothetical protein
MSMRQKALLLRKDVTLRIKGKNGWLAWLRTSEGVASLLSLMEHSQVRQCDYRRIKRSFMDIRLCTESRISAKDY